MAALPDDYLEVLEEELMYDHYADDEYAVVHHYLYQSIQCAVGVFESLRPFVSRALALALLQRLIWLPDLHNRHAWWRRGTDAVVGALGVWMVWENYANASQPISLFAYFMMTHSAIQSFRHTAYCGHLCAFATILFNSFCQFYWFDAVDFTAFRGALMVASMKQISLAYDISSLNPAESVGVSELDTFSAFSYVFNPSTLLFGPFISFEAFMSARRATSGGQSTKQTFRFIGSSLQRISIALVFVLHSSCFAEILALYFADNSHQIVRRHSQIWWFFRQFFTAQSFRFSHYFVSTFCVATAVLGGFDVEMVETTRWTAIEWPTSILDVVVFWNLPMHNFLNKYVFQKARQSVGYFAAMLLTFSASSFLHGFNFQLSAVLISLAFYAYAEKALRSQLAKALKACVKSRACDTSKTECSHRYKRTSFLPIVINVVFVFLNLYHLAYLGAPFVSNNDINNDVEMVDVGEEYAQVGYSWRHTLHCWREWHFSSHLVILLTLLLSFVLRYLNRNEKKKIK